jgi:ABC-2 type transport system ATP-binding protein
MISIHNLSIVFDKHKQLAFTGKDFAEAQVHGIIGLNGAGKTTFFNLLATVLKASSGHIRLGEKEMSRAEVCYLETSNYFYPGITGQEYLDIFPATNRQFSLSAINELLRLPLNQLTETYSTGMKKRLALMAILKQDKPVYIFDEPFNGLDLETSRVLQLSIQVLKKKGKTIFISSHILESLTGICDQIHLLKKGVFIKQYDTTTYQQINADLFDGFDQEAAGIVAGAL